MRPVVPVLALAGVLACAGALAAGSQCTGRSASTLTPVIELYTSEGCSSCPPADRWVSGLKSSVANGEVVVEAFHVGYWDYIGWVDRFARPAYTARQRQVASWNHQSGVYTPQLVRNGRDWRDYSHALASAGPARATIAMQRKGENAFDAQVTPAEGVGAWGAYWTVTENGHNSKVKAGENAGEFLQHDFLVRQYVAAREYHGPSKLTLRAIPAQADHPRQVNLVVFDPKSGKPLQALSVGC